MKSRHYKFACLGIMGASLASPALASGFDNTGIGSLDLLYDPAKFAVEFGASYVDRNVDYEASNPKKFKVGTDGKPYSFEDMDHEGKAKARATPNVWNYQVGAKVALTDRLSCLGRVLNPGTILEEVPEDWLGKYSVVTTDLQSKGMDATCSFQVPVSKGHYVRVIGGGRYLEADLHVAKAINLLGFVDTSVDLNLSGRGFGYSIGAAYEVPEYAIRASVVYDSAIELDASGTFQTPDFEFGPATGSASGSATSKLPMPQAVEINLQTGIAPKWLAMLSAKWVNWSALNSLDVNIDAIAKLGPGEIPLDLKSSRIFNFKDGWTIRAGIGHQLTEKLQVAGAVTWDQGIGGSYSDTWQLSLGGAYQINEHVKLSLGGALAYKTAAKNELVRNTTQIADGYPTGDQFDLSYDASLNFGVLTKLKISF